MSSLLIIIDRLKRISFHLFSFTALVLLCYASLLLIELTLPYLAFKPNIDFLLTKQLVYHKTVWRWGFYIHIFSSCILILFGAFQFSRYLQTKKPAVHRLIGKVYVFTVLVLAAPSALILAAYANGGITTQISFILLTALWFYTTLQGFITIRKREVEQHANWLFRSYALTLSAVTLRFYAYLIDLFHINVHPVDAYIWISWLSWTINILLAEIMVRTGTFRRLFIY